jgi:D-sedoheptulose 7-phosphate isomerase
MNKTLQNLIEKYPDLENCKEDIVSAFQLLVNSFSNGGKLLICGNGGSASDCEHIVGELMKGFMSRRVLSREQKELFVNMYGEHGNDLANHLQGALPAISLVSHTSLITALANDISADMIFAQQVYGLGVPGDTVLGISTSGNSQNIIHALQVAKAKGLHTIGLTGRSGGFMKDVCDVIIRVPYDSTPDVQERHLPIYHALCILLEEKFFA